jgi:inner membrane transporter RhtA
MSGRSGPGMPVPPWGLALAAMFSVQLGSALSVGLIETVGPAGTAWLRLTMGALLFLTIGRPPWRHVRLPDLPVLLGLGVATGVVTIVFLASIERIPLGTAVAVEFLGPLTVAGVRSHTPRALAWPALALVGVVLLTQPWRGEVNIPGLLFAALAACGSVTATQGSEGCRSPSRSPLPRRPSWEFRRPQGMSTAASCCRRWGSHSCSRSFRSGSR